MASVGVELVVTDGRWAGIGERVDAVELLLDGPRQGEGIQAIALAAERGRPGGVEAARGEHPLQRRPGRIVAAPDARADALLPEQLHGGQKEILEQPQLLAVQSVDGGAGDQGVVAHVAQQLANVGPVLLFEMRIVVLLLRPAPRELDLVRLTVP
jgi:hypothetical protein